MKGEFEYDLKMALLTAFVLTFGGLIVFSINAKDYVNPNWEGFTYIVIPILWILSFAPLGIAKIITKIQNGKKK